ncbi:MAG: hypothetical protein HZA03_12055 [Nitrospinae bacterium]|nr:hypothetical protein [Nitrospinota bacterium]
MSGGGGKGGQTMGNRAGTLVVRRLYFLIKGGLGIGLMLFLNACNTPPLYESKAREFLTGQGVSASTILKLEERSPLSAEEVVMLSRFNDVSTLHLLGSNPSTPREILMRLARHRIQDVRWGAATNPNTPKELLLKLRTQGRYSTTNGYLARNPALPEEIIREMFRAKEVAWYDIAMNTACPIDLMREILERGTDTDRTWLAWNRNLPPEIMERLAKDPSPGVARMLSGNPTYARWKKKPSLEKP